MALDKHDIPPPNRYTIEGDFDPSIMTKKRGFSFGYGRDEVVGGPLSDTKRARYIPGPGQYGNYSTLQARSTVIRSRLPDNSLNEHIKVQQSSKLRFLDLVATTLHHLSARGVAMCYPTSRTVYIRQSHRRVHTTISE